MSVPAPIGLQASSQLIGTDGSWYTFPLRIGTPAQTMQVVPSTLIAEDMVVNLSGCTSSSASNCATLRGGLFDNTSSSSYTTLGSGLYSLSIEGGLGITGDSGFYGYDTVGITTVNGGGVVLDHQVVIDYATTDFYVGMMGLSAQASTAGGNTQPSFLKSLYAKNQIPSLSYAYTAGAPYRNGPPSLTFGGQDSTLFQPNSINFTMEQGGGRDLVPAVQAITVDVGGSSISMLTDGIEMFIDSTQPYIWLPQTACDAFAKSFGLTGPDEITGRYTINGSSHTANLKLDAKIIFQLSNTLDGTESVNITFPYSAFELNYTNEHTSSLNRTLMFPIRQQSNQQAYVLGRAFLQEAYLAVNHDFSNFSIYQATSQSSDHQPHLIPLASVRYPNITEPIPSGTVVPQPCTNCGGGISGGAIGGIVVAAVVVIGAIVGFLLWRRHHNAQKRRASRGGVVETTYSAPEGPMPPELEQRAPPPMQQQQDYFGKSAFQQKPYHGPTLSSDSSQRGELESPGIGGYSSGMSSPRDPIGAYHANAQEMAAAETERYELPARKLSFKMAAHAAPAAPTESSAMNMQQSVLLPASPAEQPAAGPAAASYSDGTTRYEGAAGAATRPNMMSANSVTIVNPGSASLVSHTRTPPRQSFGSLISGPSTGTPLHSAGPSVDEEHILAVTTRAYNTIPDEPASPSNPIVAGMQRSGSGRSQDTLVNSHGQGSGRHSPVVPRRQAPDLEPPTPVDEFVTNSPEHGSLGYGSNWEQGPRHR